MQKKANGSDFWVSNIIETKKMEKVERILAQERQTIDKVEATASKSERRKAEESVRYAATNKMFTEIRRQENLERFKIGSFKAQDKCHICGYTRERGVQNGLNYIIHGDVNKPTQTLLPHFRILECFDHLSKLQNF